MQKESVVINITNQGYIKRGPLSSLKAQKEVEKEKLVYQQEDDFVVQILRKYSRFIFFNLDWLQDKSPQNSEGTSASKGKSIFNILPLKSHHSISSIMPLPEDEIEWKNLMVVFATAKGNVRKNSLEDFTSINNSGKIAMKLDPDDKIIDVKICKDDQDILLSTQYGKCIRFKAKKLRLFKGRSSKGIKGIKLKDQDKVISLSILENTHISTKTLDKSKKIKSANDKFILMVSENGYGKRSSYLDYRVTNRGGKGIIGIINSPRNGNISSSLVVNETDEILLSTDKGSIMRCAVKEIRIAGRNTQGVRIKKLSGSEKVVSVIKIEDNIH